MMLLDVVPHQSIAAEAAPTKKIAVEDRQQKASRHRLVQADRCFAAESTTPENAPAFPVYRASMHIAPENAPAFPVYRASMHIAPENAPAFPVYRASMHIAPENAPAFPVYRASMHIKKGDHQGPEPDGRRGFRTSML
ncbi:MAG: hypothetical protein ABIO49_13645 [Dokdonella sp.]